MPLHHVVKHAALQAFGSTVLASGLGLSIAYGLAYGECAPPDLVCLTGRVGCIALCVNAWGQSPQVVAVGLLLGAAPGLVAFTLVLAACRRTSRRFRILWGISSSLLGSSLAVAVVIAAYPFMGDIMRGLVSVLIPALAVVASLAWSGVVSLHQGPDRRVRVA